jgi:hypothetical protein
MGHCAGFETARNRFYKRTAASQDEARFDFPATAQTPHGAADFVEESVFDKADRSELLPQGAVERFADLVVHLGLMLTSVYSREENRPRTSIVSQGAK